MCQPVGHPAFALAHPPDMETMLQPHLTTLRAMYGACCRAQKLFPNFIVALKADGGDFKAKEADLVDVSPEHACQATFWLPPLSDSRTTSSPASARHVSFCRGEGLPLMPPGLMYPVGVQSLQEIDTYLRDHGRTPFLGGDRPNAVDCMLAPRLYHVQVAMKELKVWCERNVTLAACVKLMCFD